MKVRVWEDELFPFFTISDSESGYEVEVSEEFRARYYKAMTEFEHVQDELGKVYRSVAHIEIKP